jgi:hypothetical protein
MFGRREGVWPKWKVLLVVQLSNEAMKSAEELTLALRELSQITEGPDSWWPELEPKTRRSEKSSGGRTFPLIDFHRNESKSG